MFNTQPWPRSGCSVLHCAITAKACRSQRRNPLRAYLHHEAKVHCSKRDYSLQPLYVQLSHRAFATIARVATSRTVHS